MGPTRLQMVRALAEEARAATFRLEEALGVRDASNPDFDLRQRCYRARIEIGEAAYAFSKREEGREGRR